MQEPRLAVKVTIWKELIPNRSHAWPQDTLHVLYSLLFDSTPITGGDMSTSPHGVAEGAYGDAVDAGTRTHDFL